MTVVTALLPAEFADLEPFAADWCLPERAASASTSGYASTMAEMQAFYDAITPRAEAAMTYLDQYTLDDLPPEALNLMHLLYSMIMVSFPVECWHQPRVPDSGVADVRLRRRTRHRERRRSSCGPIAGSTSTPARCGHRR